MRVLQCPRCKGTELDYYEICEEIGTVDPGAIQLGPDGLILPGRTFMFEAGEIIARRLRCEACQHDWTARWPFADFEEGIRS